MHRFALLAALAALLASPAGRAQTPSRAELRAAVRERQSLRASWRQALVRTATDKLGESPQLYHQIREPAHRAAWKAQLGGDKRPSLAAVSRWMGSGSYPGIWTIEDSSGWYASSMGKPIRLSLRPEMILYDGDLPEHRRVYDEWLANEKKLRGPSPRNLFDSVTDGQGVPLSRRASIVSAPAHERFYRELGIAGVAYYDTYGRKCIVLLNPAAIRQVTFPD
jgi:hypothetical protein